MILFLKKINSVITALLTTVAIIVAVIGLLATTTFRGEIKALIVRSGSMEPTLPVGSLIVTRKADQYQTGDVITFKQQSNFVTHRIVEVADGGYRTQGDANKVADTNLVAPSNSIGKLWFFIPMAGKALTFIKKPLGFGLLIMLPALWIVIGEIFAIGREIDKIKHVKAEAKKKIVDMRVVPTKSKVDRLVKQENKASRARLGQAMVMMTVALLGGLGGTKAYFTDVAQSTNNVFTASTFVAQVLVINEVLPSYACPKGNTTTDEQWIEVYNGYSTPVDLKDFQITDGTATVSLIKAQSATIQPGAFTLISHDNSIFGNGKCFPTNGADTQNLGTGTLNLNPASRTLVLKDKNGTIIDNVQWSGATGLTLSANQSIERNPDGKDTATGNTFSAADFVVRTTPQPGL
jgi:signal peptidase I